MCAGGGAEKGGRRQTVPPLTSAEVISTHPFPFQALDRHAPRMKLAPSHFLSASFCFSSTSPRSRDAPVSPCFLDPRLPADHGWWILAQPDLTRKVGRCFQFFPPVLLERFRRTLARTEAGPLQRIFPIVSYPDSLSTSTLEDI